LILNEQEAYFILAETSLKNYVYSHSDGKSVILALGTGSLYNHRNPSNAEYDFQAKKQQMIIFAVSDIKAGDEIFINYGGTYNAPYESYF
jgi:SET domain-containing protein